MLYIVDGTGQVHTFEDFGIAAASLARTDMEGSVDVAVDDRGVLYEHSYEAEPGFYGYTLRATNIWVPAALAILRQHADAEMLSPIERHELALCLPG